MRLSPFFRYLQIVFGFVDGLTKVRSGFFCHVAWHLVPVTRTLTTAVNFSMERTYFPYSPHGDFVAFGIGSSGLLLPSDLAFAFAATLETRRPKRSDVNSSSQATI